jgi:hypothetical protein
MYASGQSVGIVSAKSSVRFGSNADALACIGHVRFTAVCTPIISEQIDRKIFGTKTHDLAVSVRLGQRRDEHEKATHFGACNSARCVFRRISRSRWQ